MMLVKHLPALALVALGGCKPKPSDEPQHASEARHGYTDAYTAGASSVAPIEVCMHLAGLAAAEAGVSEPEFDPNLIADCERELSLEAAARGSENWSGMAACVLQARNGPDIDACNLAHPMPNPETRSLPGADSRERAVCDHLVELVLLETLAENEALPMISHEERSELIDECMVTLRDDHQPSLHPADYDALLTCLLDARSSEQIQAC
jgi:hypothetical protein